MPQEERDIALGERTCGSCRTYRDPNDFFKYPETSSGAICKTCIHCRQERAARRAAYRADSGTNASTKTKTRAPLQQLDANIIRPPLPVLPKPVQSSLTPPTTALPPVPHHVNKPAEPAEEPTPTPTPPSPLRPRTRVFSDFSEATTVVVAPRKRGRPRKVALTNAPAWKNWEASIPPSDFGALEETCPDCGALHFTAEKIDHWRDGLHYQDCGSKCCSYGDVALKLPTTPGIMMKLWVGQDPQAREFRKNARRYNNAMAFTSFKYNEDTRLSHLRGGVKSFSAHGKIYHYQGPLTEAPGEQPVFNQLFLHDPDYATDKRLDMDFNRGLNRTTIVELDLLIRDVNPFIKLYKTAKEMVDRITEEHTPENPEPWRVVLSPQMKLIYEKTDGVHKGRVNLPAAAEVALIIPDELDDGRAKGPRDLILAERCFDSSGKELPMQKRLNSIHVTHPSYIPLHYTLLYPYGEPGFHYGLQLRVGANRKNIRLGQQAFYRYHTMIRHSVAESNGTWEVPQGQYFNPLFHAQALFEQYLVDSFAACQEKTLLWIRNNQDKLRADVYSGLADSLHAGDTDARQIGKRVILPSSFTGSDRYMQQAYQDAMAMVRRQGKPSFFITFTCNPKWREITNHLMPGQQARDRPDLIARVFNLKAKELIKDLKEGFFGLYVGHVMTIEYQKRGLPHMHLLLNVSRDFPYDTPDLVDQVVSAELPNKEIDPEAYDIVTSSMLHGPCGEDNPGLPCMFEFGKPSLRGCTKDFPKAFQATTTLPDDKSSFPNYRRRDDRQYHTIRKLGKEIKMDNRWVVPYNPALLRKFKAHINIEVCANLGAIKYVYKYIEKGHDRTAIQVEDELKEDELYQYVAGRYLTPAEAYWRLHEFDTNSCYPPVTRLDVHLEDQQTVFYGECANANELLDRMAKSRTKLLSWFEYNRQNAHLKGALVNYKGEMYPDNRDLSHVKYQDFPEFAAWDEKCRKWKVRAGKVPWRLQKKLKAIGRMYHASITSGERYHLRLLLTVIHGAQSYAELRTFDGVEHATYRKACIARGLEKDDKEWELCFEECKVWQSSRAMRSTFVMGLTQKLLDDPLRIWDLFKVDFADSALKHELEKRCILLPPTIPNPVEDYALWLIDNLLRDFNADLSLEVCGLPSFQFDRY